MLSDPFILPACSTLAACSMTTALRGTMTLPSIITGSSRIDLNVAPVLVESTSIACVSRTLSTVPLGTVTGFGAAVGGGGGGGGGGGLRAVNSTDATSSTLNSAIDPLPSRTRTIFTSALRNEPSTLFPLRSLTRSAESVASAISRTRLRQEIHVM